MLESFHSKCFGCFGFWVAYAMEIIASMKIKMLRITKHNNFSSSDGVEQLVCFSTKRSGTSFEITSNSVVHVNQQEAYRI